MLLRASPLASSGLPSSAGGLRRFHSNGRKGPHAAYISIGNPNADRKDSAQTWHDSTYTDGEAKAFYNYTVLLNCISQYRGQWMQTSDFGTIMKADKR